MGWGVGGTCAGFWEGGRGHSSDGYQPNFHAHTVFNRAETPFLKSDAKWHVRLEDVSLYQCPQGQQRQVLTALLYRHLGSNKS